MIANLTHPVFNKAELFGRYIEREFLGHGSFSNCYHVTREADGLDYAIKKPKHSPIILDRIDEMTAARFHTEAWVHTALTQIPDKPEELVEAYGYGYPNNPNEGRFIVLELITGKELENIIHSLTFSKHPINLRLEAILDVARKVCGVLQFLEGYQISHRDIKPSNIFIGKSDELYDNLILPLGGDIINALGKRKVKLSDLSIIKIPKDGIDSLISYDMLGEVPNEIEDTEGALIGSLIYMSPSATRAEFDFKGEVYGLGCVIYETLRCKKPCEAIYLRDVIEGWGGNSSP